jgi:hypothetical protein
LHLILHRAAFCFPDFCFFLDALRAGQFAGLFNSGDLRVKTIMFFICFQVAEFPIRPEPAPMPRFQLGPRAPLWHTLAFPAARQRRPTINHPTIAADCLFEPPHVGCYLAAAVSSVVADA